MIYRPVVRNDEAMRWPHVMARTSLAMTWRVREVSTNSMSKLLHLPHLALRAVLSRDAGEEQNPFIQSCAIALLKGSTCLARLYAVQCAPVR